MRTAGLVNLFAVLFRPVTALASLLSNGLVKGMGLNPHESDQPATEEEILMMVDESGESSIEASEKDMIADIFDFWHQCAGDHDPSNRFGSCGGHGKRAGCGGFGSAGRLFPDSGVSRDSG